MADANNSDSEISAEVVSRREAIRRAMIAAGATSLISSSVLFNAACASSTQRVQAVQGTPLFSNAEIVWLDEVAETLLPQTQTPGAKAARVGAFMGLMVTDCLSPLEQQEFKVGMSRLEAQCVESHGVGFMSAAPRQRLALLEDLDRARAAAAQAGGNAHYFHRFKELAVLGFFTSEVGYNQVLRYQENPGRYDPCVEYQVGDPQWARHA